VILGHIALVPSLSLCYLAHIVCAEQLQTSGLLHELCYYYCILFALQCRNAVYMPVHNTVAFVALLCNNRQTAYALYETVVDL
jgi:hypothetical protein